jgi:hypothetical protein
MMMHPQMGSMAAYGGYPMTEQMFRHIDADNQWGNGGYLNPSAYCTDGMNYMLYPNGYSFVQPSTMATHAPSMSCSTSSSSSPFSMASTMANPYYFRPNFHPQPM